MVAKIKLVAIDMDGTLLNDQLEVGTRTKKKINELVQKGIYVILATGRTFKAAQHYAIDLELNVPIITYNGALIKNVITEGIIYSSKLDVDTAKKVIQLGEKEKIYTKVYVDDTLWVEEDNEEAKLFISQHRINYEVKGKLSENIDKEPYMVVFKDTIDKISKIREVFAKEELPGISHTFSTPYSLEIMSEGVSKQTALQQLATKLGITREEILAIGNSLNDYDMLEWAGHGVAMKNSDKALLDIWNNISEYTNNEEGVAYILDKFFQT